MERWGFWDMASTVLPQQRAHGVFHVCQLSWGSPRKAWGEGLFATSLLASGIPESRNEGKGRGVGRSPYQHEDRPLKSRNDVISGQSTEGKREFIHSACLPLIKDLPTEA